MQRKEIVTIRGYSQGQFYVKLKCICECIDVAQEAFRANSGFPTSGIASAHIPESRFNEPCSLDNSHLNLALGASDRIRGIRQVRLENLDSPLMHCELMTRGDTTNNDRNQQATI